MVTLIAMNTRLRELIKTRMIDLNISQIELAERLSVASSHVSRIISGDRGTTLENLIAIADILKIERTYFLRVASGLNTEAGKDQWVEEMSHKLNLIPPGLRTVAGKFIDSMVQGEEAEEKPTKSRVKPAKI